GARAGGWRLAGPRTGGVAPAGPGGGEPGVRGTGPIPAVTRALGRAGLKVEQMELIEANEAFAAQALAVARALRLPPEITNVSGGAIALGHPLGASGCRVLVTLLHGIRRLPPRVRDSPLCP